MSKRYHVRLQCPAVTHYRAQRAANSVDLNVAEKLTHELTVDADLESPFNVGVIVGASGSGKSTLAREMFGPDCFDAAIDADKDILCQLPGEWDFDSCVALLTGIGLNSVPCWLRPLKTLSNGQRARADAAILMSRAGDSIVCIDEWSSVVDRTVAKAMSHCVQKFARRSNRRLVLCSCHYDVLPWLAPDWVLDCNTATFSRHSAEEWAKKKSELRFDVHPVPRSTWQRFSKYHYLSKTLPVGHIETFGLFFDGVQVGFQCFANYVPDRKGTRRKMHSNRTVIHPDYCGLGLGIKLIDETSAIMNDRGFEVMAKFSSEPVYRAMKRNPRWALVNVTRQIERVRSGSGMQRGKPGRGYGFRDKCRTFSFRYVPDNSPSSKG